MSGRKYTQEEIEYLFLIVPGHSHKEITALFNNHFEAEIKISQVKSFIKNRKLNTGRTGRFVKGQVSHNKGKKGISYPSMKPTQFKTGEMPHNHKPVGSETLRADGYVWVKVEEPKTWRMKHVLIWEDANGPVPKGYAVLFGDGNRLNFDLNNLILVSKAQLVMLNKKGLIRPDAELTRTGIIIADLHIKIAERKRRK